MTPLLQPWGAMRSSCIRKTIHYCKNIITNWHSKIQLKAQSTNLKSPHTALIHQLLHRPKPAMTNHGPTICDVIPFYDKRCFFMTNLSRKKKFFKKCPNKRDPVNWARFTCEKPITFDWQNRRKIWSSRTTCHFLLKNFTFFSAFWKTFTS